MNIDQRLNRVAQQISHSPDPHEAAIQASLLEVSTEDLKALYDFLIDLEGGVFPEKPTAEQSRLMDLLAHIHRPLDE